jgi:hypothetical protein
MLLVFAATLINTVILIVLSNMSAIEFVDYKKAPEIAALFPKNGFTDFSPKWYQTVGYTLT